MGMEKQWSKKALLIDIDGVLAVSDQPIPGAADAIRWLDDEGIRYRFISNSTQRSRQQIADRLNSIGFSIRSDQISTPVTGALRLLQEEGITRCHLLMTDAAKMEFLAAGITDTQQNAGVVIIGDAGDGFTFDAMNGAFRLIHDGAPLIALERDRYWMASDGLTLGAGPFVAALEYASGTTARIMGKPSPDAFLTALVLMGASPEETAMIGDDIRTDIEGGQLAGLSGVLVRTGKYSDQAVIRSGITPDRIIPSIAWVRQLFE
jgi:HAD superfamily hydrolase (TIGR01458 family)